MSKYYKVQNSTILYLNSSFNCVKSNSIGLTKTQAGSGYTSAPTITITTAPGDMGSSASATVSLTSGAINTITMTNNGSGYNTVPIVTISGGGNPGVITGYSSLVGGSGYAAAPTLSLSGGGGGSNFAGYTSLTPTTLSSNFTISNGGAGYAVNDILNFNYIGTGGSNVVAKVATLGTSNSISTISLTNAGSNFLYKAPTISSITTTGGSNAVITCSLNPTSVGSINITNGGSYYSTLPSFVFTPVSGGTGASATPTINIGTPAILTPLFTKTYSYTWNNLPPINITDLARLSAINIVATNFNTSTPYTYRIVGLQYTSRDTYFSDQGNPILSMAQNVNICSIGSLGGSNFAIVLTPQTIQSITITADDDITTKGSGQDANINLVIALEIEEFDPTTTEINNPYGESISRLRLQY